MFIGVAKGELGEFCDAYLKKRGATFDIRGPLTQYDELPGGKVIYRVQNSRDVARFIGDEDIPNDFGITGSDCMLDELCAGNKRISAYVSLGEVAKELGFEKLLGEMVLLLRGGEKPKGRKRPVVCVKDYYPNFVRWQLRQWGMKPAEYRLEALQGAVEGFLMDPTTSCDIAFETMFSGDTLEKQNGAQKENKKPEIRVERKVLGDITPVIVYDNKKFCFGDFDKLFYE
jgi:ATP phosphoribosyltransferase